MTTTNSGSTMKLSDATAAASTLRVEPLGRYSLAASKRFLEGFTPASGGSASVDAAGAKGTSLALAFRLEGTWAPVGALLHQADVDEAVTFDVVCDSVDDQDAVVKQAARMLGLDVDARAWGNIGKRDPVLGALLKLDPGWRPVAFASPWEAAVWGLLVHRISMKQAAGIKRKVAEQYGDVVEIGGRRMALFPSPSQVLAMPQRPPAIPDEKWLRIAGVAQAALDGKLDAEKLRLMSSDVAHEKLGALRGVGSWTAGHIHIRGAATVDVVALEESRVRAAVQVAYKLKGEPDDDEINAIADRWKPYRTWAMVLLAMHLKRTGGWNMKTTAKRGARRPSVKKGATSTKTKQKTKKAKSSRK